MQNILTILIIVIVVLVPIILLVKLGIKEKNKKKDNKKSLINSLALISEEEAEYKKIKLDLKIPEQALRVSYKQGYIDMPKTSTYTWREEDNICFFPTLFGYDLISDLTVKKIPINDIIYFKIEGKLHYEDKIIGGGGGGSSVKGALLGAVIAGGAGAIIGSRRKINSINSEHIEHDERGTIINFYDEDKNIRSICFSYRDYEIFSEIIPEKSYEEFELKKNSVSSIWADKNNQIVDQLKKLKVLLDDKIISKDEFEKKKYNLLQKLLE